MAQLLPQEMEVRYLLPALRKELTDIFLDTHKLKQREVAQLLGLTEAAISQYRRKVRGHDLHFNEVEIAIIKEYAQKIIDDKKEATHLLYKLSVALKGYPSLCALHKKIDPELPHNCDWCREKH